MKILVNPMIPFNAENHAKYQMQLQWQIKGVSRFPWKTPFENVHSPIQLMISM